MPDDYGAALAAFTAHVQQRRDQLPLVLWQQTSQQHFKAPQGSGEYPGGGPPFECGPIANLSVVASAAREQQGWLQELQGQDWAPRAVPSSAVGAGPW